MQRHSRLRAHWLMTIVAGGWGGIPRELQRLLSLIGYGSTGGVCGRSLMAGKILFTGRQTCSLYLVLWLGVSEATWVKYVSVLCWFIYSWIRSFVYCKVFLNILLAPCLVATVIFFIREPWILIKVQCVTYQWFRLDKLYKLMKSFFLILEFFFSN